MSAPALIYLALILISVGVELSQHGQSKMKTSSIWSSMFSYVITCGLLYWGGFFAKVPA